LTEKEKRDYENDRIRADEYIIEQRKLVKDLKDIPNYMCPLCKQESPINKFRGDMMKAVCPKCKKKFDTTR
jgi:transposase-like protein